MPTRVPTFKRTDDAGRADRQKFYSTAPWRHARERFLRSHPLCAMMDHPIAGKTCERVARVVDHRTPMSMGGAKLDESNFRALCYSCNAAITRNFRDTGVNEFPAKGLK